MIKSYDIDNTVWEPITVAGQSGTCWLDEDGDGEEGRVDVRIYHTSAGTPSADVLTDSKRVYKPRGNTDILVFTADDANDIYYARCKNEEDKARIQVDVV